MKRFSLFALLFIQFVAINAKFSLPKAVLFSAAVPGTGQMYLNKPTKAGIFFTTELTFLFSYFRFQQERDWTIKSYKQYAESAIGLEKTNSDNMYSLIQMYFSSEDYNDSVREYARDRYLLFDTDTEEYYEFLANNLIPEEEGWHWQTTKNWNKYKNLRRDKQDFEIYANFAMGALVLNRIISVIDAALTTKKLNRLTNKLSIQPDFDRNGFEVTYEISF
jgi:TM2 domain-containing membrane protein YozV